MLLRGVFEEFRNMWLEYDRLNPREYFSSPGLSWDAMLKERVIKLDLITDVYMYQLIEKKV